LQWLAKLDSIPALKSSVEQAIGEVRRREREREREREIRGAKRERERERERFAG